MKKHNYTKKEAEFLKNNIEGTSYKELHKMFNKKFNLNLTYGQIRGYLKNHNLTNGRDTRFQKGNTPLSPIKKGQRIGVETQFKPGQRPHNYKPVGFERVDRDGYTLIKISDRGTWNERWRHKHKVLWEKHNGPIPKGHKLIFADGDKTNITLENLILVTNAQMLIINQHDLIKDNHPELTKTGTLIAKVLDVGYKRKK